MIEYLNYIILFNVAAVFLIIYHQNDIIKTQRKILKENQSIHYLFKISSSTNEDVGNSIFEELKKISIQVSEIRDQFNELLYEVRQDRGSDIDFSKNFTNITE